MIEFKKKPIVADILEYYLDDYYHSFSILNFIYKLQYKFCLLTQVALLYNFNYWN
jgi:hypothetical protein